MACAAISYSCSGGSVLRGARVMQGYLTPCMDVLAQSGWRKHPPFASLRFGAALSVLTLRSCMTQEFADRISKTCPSFSRPLSPHQPIKGLQSIFPPSLIFTPPLGAVDHSDRGSHYQWTCDWFILSVRSFWISVWLTGRLCLSVLGRCFNPKWCNTKQILNTQAKMYCIAVYS